MKSVDMQLQSTNTPESLTDSSERKRKINRALLYVAGIGLGLTVIAGTAGCSDSSDTPEFYGRIDPTIASVDVFTGASIREVPVVNDRYDPDNVVETVDETATIKAHDDIYRSYDEYNVLDKDWYGIPKKDLPGYDPKTDDPNHIEWVNGQQAKAKRTPTSLQ